MRMSFGPHIFPLNPTTYGVPAIKDVNIGYGLDGTMTANTGLYNQAEFTLTWENVINDINGIVVYLKNFIRTESERVANGGGPRFFNDGVGVYRGYATLVGATIGMHKAGPSVGYTISITFRLH